MEQDKKSNGAFIGLVVIIIILIVGGIYMWQKNQQELKQMQAQYETLSNKDAENVNKLELDANNTDTSTGVDASTVN